LRVAFPLALFGDDKAKGNSIVPASIRERFASTLDGGFKSVYNALQVRTEAKEADKLLIHMPQMNEEIADGLVRSTGEKENFWNGVCAFGFSEVIFSGDNYRRSIPKNQFIP
jgi:hypothetical protein